MTPRSATGVFVHKPIANERHLLVYHCWSSTIFSLCRSIFHIEKLVSFLRNARRELCRISDLRLAKLPDSRTWNKQELTGLAFLFSSLSLSRLNLNSCHCIRSLIPSITDHWFVPSRDRAPIRIRSTLDFLSLSVNYLSDAWSVTWWVLVEHLNKIWWGTIPAKNSLWNGLWAIDFEMDAKSICWHGKVIPKKKTLG